MKKILFDLLSAQPLGSTKFHGGGEYIKTIFENIINNYSHLCEIIVFYNYDNFMDNWVKKILREKKIKTYDIKKIENVSEIFKKEKIDIFYSGLPYNLKDDYIPKDICKVGTIHGLRALEKNIDKYAYLYTNKPKKIVNKLKMITNYDFIKSKKKYFQNIKLLDKIICDSEHTKYSICNYYPNVSTNHIKVYYPPEKKIEDEAGENKKNEENNRNEKYFLLISADRWIKNSYRTIKAIDTLFSEKKLQNYKAVVVGCLPNKIRKKIKNQDKYKLIDYVSSNELETLYKNCDFFIYPTLNEGFGMPPLEAMKYGKTCIVSAVTSLPEICGNAVYYINPYDIYEIRNRILQAVENKIKKEVIKNQLDKINKRQKEDLNKVCEYIIGINE